MTTYVSNPADLDLHLETAFAYDETLTATVANPRRTTWTGFAKADTERLPAS